MLVQNAIKLLNPQGIHSKDAIVGIRCHDPASWPGRPRKAQREKYSINLSKYFLSLRRSMHVYTYLDPGEPLGSHQLDSSQDQATIYIYIYIYMHMYI